MARYVKIFELNDSDSDIFNQLKQYLYSEGYSHTLQNGESLYTKSGMLRTASFIKFAVNENVVTMEAWSADGTLNFKGGFKSDIGIVESMLGSFSSKSYCPEAPKPVQPEPAVTVEKEQPRTQPVSNSSGKSGFCIRCGAKLTSGAAFCASCGNKVGQSAGGTATSSTVRPLNNSYVRPTYTPVNNTVNVSNNTYTQQSTYATTQGTGKFSQLTFKNYLKYFADQTVKKRIKYAGVFGYLCTVFFFVYLAVIQDAVEYYVDSPAIMLPIIFFFLTLGMHKGKSKGCAYCILILSVIVMLSALNYDVFTGWWWFIEGVLGISAFSYAKRKYKLFKGQN